jgi:hypothetical protein
MSTSSFSMDQRLRCSYAMGSQRLLSRFEIMQTRKLATCYGLWSAVVSSRSYQQE